MNKKTKPKKHKPEIAPIPGIPLKPPPPEIKPIPEEEKPGKSYPEIMPGTFPEIKPL